MKLKTKIFLLLIFISTGIIIGRIAGSSAVTPQTSSSYETKENDEGSVQVSVTPLTFKPGFPVSFDVAFETHSVDLAFDVAKIAALTDGTGTSYTPVWDGSPPGGHHRRGTLRFTPDLPAGKAGLARTKMITLTLRDIAGIPTRTLTWEVKNQ